jgi:hypothetical protein
VSEPRIIQPVRPTRPSYSLREAELLMRILLSSGHPQAEHLVTKLVTAAEQPGAYIELMERVRASVILNHEGPRTP